VATCLVQGLVTILQQQGRLLLSLVRPEAIALDGLAVGGEGGRSGGLGIDGRDSSGSRRSENQCAGLVFGK
jgi:hypothetical protein